jgi:NAD(P)-dependent dehydrogenase (short-subunit alcohol dehydrogenase family)
MRAPETPDVVVITGAAAGVGRAAAQAFAKRRAHLGLIARGGPGMDGREGAKRDVEAAGGKALIVPADVADAAQVEAAAAKVEAERGSHRVSRMARHGAVQTVYGMRRRR